MSDVFENQSTRAAPPLKQWEAHPYYRRTLGEPDAPGKARVRDRVAAHIAENRDTHVGYTRFFGLPGAEWRFERELAARIRRSMFVGVEREWGVLEYGARFMPRGAWKGNLHYDAPWWVRRKDAWLMEQEADVGKFDGYQTNRARILHCDLDSLLRTRRALANDPVRRKLWSEFRGRFFNWAAFWLDLFSPVGTLLPLLASIDKCLLPVAVRVPFAVTFLVGRDDEATMAALDQERGDPVERRTRLISRTLDAGKFRTCSTTETLTYDDGSTMAVVLGVLERRPGTFQEDMPVRLSSTQENRPPC